MLALPWVFLAFNGKLLHKIANYDYKQKANGLMIEPLYSFFRENLCDCSFPNRKSAEKKAAEKKAADEKSADNQKEEEASDDDKDYTPRQPAARSKKSSPVAVKRPLDAIVDSSIYGWTSTKFISI